MQLTQVPTGKTIDELIAHAEMERMARLFLKRRNRRSNAAIPDANRRNN